jgi:hypothetical protein
MATSLSNLIRIMPVYADGEAIRLTEDNSKASAQSAEQRNPSE